MSEIAAVLEAATKSGRLSPGDKRWISAKIKEERDHETNMMLLKAFASDPDLKYYVGMAAGFGIPALQVLLNTSFNATSWGTQAKTTMTDPVTGLTTEVPAKPKEKTMVQYAIEAGFGMLVIAGGTVAGGIVGNVPGALAGAAASTAAVGGYLVLKDESGALITGLGMTDIAQRVIALSSAGFGGMCCTILILKAIFAGTDFGELVTAASTAVDAVIPF